MLTDYNEMLLQLFKQSGLNKAQFCHKIGMHCQHLNAYIFPKSEPRRLSKRVYDRFIENYNKG